LKISFKTVYNEINDKVDFTLFVVVGNRAGCFGVVAEATFLFCLFYFFAINLYFSAKIPKILVIPSIFCNVQRSSTSHYKPHSFYK